MSGDSLWYERHGKEPANLRKKVKRLRKSLKAVIAAYEQAGYIMGKQPDAITQVLIDAKQTLKETE